MKLLTEAQIAKLYKDRKYLCFEPDITRAVMVANKQHEVDKAFHNRELERIFNELERVIGFSVNKNDTPDTWDEWQSFKGQELK